MNSRAETLPTLLTAIADHARTSPDHPAVRCADRTVSYGELQDAVLRAAAGLLGLGVQPGQRVAVLGTKSIPAVVALLAVMRAGCAYVPLDPHAPPLRRRALMEDAACPLVLHDADAAVGTPAELPPGVTAVALDAVLATPGPPPPSHLADDAIAYCIYTSGSTGRPKGVQIRHRSVGAFFEAVHPLLLVSPGSRCLNTSALHFDVSVVDLLYPLWRGATVHLGPAVPLPGVLVGLLERERITHMAAVGSTLTLLATATDGFAARDIGALRRVMTGAEVIDPHTVQQWLAACPGLVVVNGYGPTEATCLVLAHPIGEREPERRTPYPIGRPLPGVRLRFLDDRGGVTDDGPGEILVAGEQVMAGYLARPEEQMRVFLEIDGDRFYRTGDQGHRGPDGVVTFHGRRDDEVKHRGYRVNLQEVNRVLQGHPDILRAFTATATDARGRPVLCCAVVRAAEGNRRHRGGELRFAEGELPVSGHEERGPALLTATLNPLPAEHASSLRAYAAGRLPRYMIPDQLHELPHVPMLSSGKPDTSRVRRLLTRAAAEATP
ncbi:amino acid adenylation domain-containing protein [Streptomyces sp. NPDC050538]|uniref:amino acid adenylation domain-containing protein n=1 Tax=Streptomyces sp. NPDC050538 TaxID=3365627 RepID=UPI00378AD4F4